MFAIIDELLIICDELRQEPLIGTKLPDDAELVDPNREALSSRVSHVR